MRPTLTLALLVITCSVSAQLQNGGFEDINTASMPSYWTTGTELIVLGDSVVVDSAKYLLNSTDVHSGQHAVELRNSYDYTLDQGSAGRWLASPFEEGYGGFPSADIAVVQRPSALRFWAKYAPVLGDSGYAEVKVYNATMDQIGVGALHIGAAASYTELVVPVAYDLMDDAAYVNILFRTMVPSGNPQLGTRMLIDDVSIDYTTTGITALEVRTLRFSPNPATDEVRIAGLSASTSATVSLLDATGRTVMAQRLNNGRLPLNTAAPGTYVVRVDQGGVVHQGRLVVAR